MSLNFGQIQSTTEIAALGVLKIKIYPCDHSGAFICNRIFFIIACKDDKYKSLDEFEF